MQETSAPPGVVFFQNHKPEMLPGDYEIRIEGMVSDPANPNAIRDENETLLTRTFAVYGERFVLQEQDLRAVFPAPGSTGEYGSILPHVIFTRNTLPWERQAKSGNAELPWLVLLLFDENELPVKKIVTVAQLRQQDGAGGAFPVFLQESAQKDDEKLTIIDVPKDLLKKLLPSAESLLLMAHTRQGVDREGAPAGEENAVVFCSRLPALGKRSTMHLVSVEGRYGDDGFALPENELVRLVSLKNWEFYTTEHFKVTSAVLDAVQNQVGNDGPALSTLLDREFAGTEQSFLDDVAQAIGKKPVPVDYSNTLLNAARFPKTFEGLLLNLNKDQFTLRLPRSKNQGAEHYLKQGLLPLEHHFRNGNRSVSWYRGPLVPFRPRPEDRKTVQELQPETADDLTRFYEESGMFDVTYSAAWELGRMLALASKDFSVSLFRWKRLLAQHVHREDQADSHSHLPVFTHSHAHEAEKPLWDLHLQPWLEQLASLQSVPGNYLLPDERLLPKESIRFFHVDPNWVVAALSGAFSVGGAWDRDSQKDKNTFNAFLDGPVGYLQGFVLRSDVVAGWPGLIVEGIAPDGTVVIPLRRQLSPDVLLCLFNVAVDQVVFHQRPEVMHFGFDRNGETFLKSLRNEEGIEQENPVSVPWQSGADVRVVDVVALARALEKAGSPASFAMNMIEGVPRVYFRI